MIVIVWLLTAIVNLVDGYTGKGGEVGLPAAGGEIKDRGVAKAV